MVSSFSTDCFCESRVLSLLLSLRRGRKGAELGIQALTALVMVLSSESVQTEIWGVCKGQALMQEKEGRGYWKIRVLL